MPEIDVLIIGGGAAGSGFAGKCLLSAAGATVTDRVGVRHGFLL